MADMLERDIEQLRDAYARFSVNGDAEDAGAYLAEFHRISSVRRTVLALGNAGFHVPFTTILRKSRSGGNSFFSLSDGETDASMDRRLALGSDALWAYTYISQLCVGDDCQDLGITCQAFFLLSHKGGDDLVFGNSPFNGLLSDIMDIGGKYVMDIHTRKVDMDYSFSVPLMECHKVFSDLKVLVGKFAEESGAVDSPIM